MDSTQHLYRLLPSVDELLSRDSLQPLLAELGPQWSRLVIRDVLQEFRSEIPQHSESSLQAALASIDSRVRERRNALLAPSLRGVINATGVILHTNLGRAPLSDEAADAVASIARSYSNLEFDLANGTRGKRDVHVERLACELTGAERTIVVNNNAAAVLLALNTFAAGREVVISRGELVEIGGGFRIPEIMARSGARLVEVGTTNRTRLADYRSAIGPNTRLILRVHRSNFEMTGFVEQPELAELVALGREMRVPLVEDLGSGCLLDIAAAGVAHEPTVAESIEAGVDVVTWSGDKLLGGPQAGLLCGKTAAIAALRENPLFRALRVDRLTYAALESTLRAYLRQDYSSIPVLRMIFAGDTENRAHALAARMPKIMHASVVETEAVIGGGATPGRTLRSHAVALKPDGLSASSLDRRLRSAAVPVVGRIEHDTLLLDVRTVFVEQEMELLNALDRIAREISEQPASKAPPLPGAPAAPAR